MITSEIEHVNAEDQIRQSARNPQPCVLCWNPTHNRGVWLPNYPSGKAIIYALCDQHAFDRWTVLRVEDAIIGRASR